MIIKLAQIPAYLVIFVLGLILFITIFTFMFSLGVLQFVFVADVVSSVILYVKAKRAPAATE